MHVRMIRVLRIILLRYTLQTQISKTRHVDSMLQLLHISCIQSQEISFHHKIKHRRERITRIQIPHNNLLCYRGRALYSSIKRIGCPGSPGNIGKYIGQQIDLAGQFNSTPPLKLMSQFLHTPCTYNTKTRSKRVKAGTGRGFVNKSASWSSDHINRACTSPLSCCAQMKWYRASMFLVLECDTGFFTSCLATCDILQLFSRETNACLLSAGQQNCASMREEDIAGGRLPLIDVLSVI